MPPLLRLILIRLGLGALTLFAVATLIFFAVALLPGDLAQEILGRDATPETLASFRAALNLDRPAHIRYVEWLAGAVQGDFGQSLANQRPVMEVIGGRMGATLFLAVYAAVLAVPLALVLGVLSALLRDTIVDRGASVFSLTAISFPEFFIGYILILVLALQSGLFPSMATVTDGMSLFERLHAAFLPALTLTLVTVAHMMRMTRAALVNLMAAPYVETARLKGASEARAVIRHALPNAYAPIVTVVALNLAYLITGVVVVETVFVYPGVSSVLVDSVAKRDIPVVQACCLIFAAVYILLNLAADVIAIATNPRLMHPR